MVWVANISQIFDGLVLPLKFVKIKHHFGFLQSNTQILQYLVNLRIAHLRIGYLDFLFSNMFCWDSLIYVWVSDQSIILMRKSDLQIET